MRTKCFVRLLVFLFRWHGSIRIGSVLLCSVLFRLNVAALIVNALSIRVCCVCFSMQLPVCVCVVCECVFVVGYSALRMHAFKAHVNV